MTPESSLTQNFLEKGLQHKKPFLLCDDVEWLNDSYGWSKSKKKQYMGNYIKQENMLYQSYKKKIRNSDRQLARKRRTIRRFQENYIKTYSFSILYHGTTLCSDVIGYICNFIHPETDKKIYELFN